MPAIPHDSTYKDIFSHPTMVEALLRGFVHEDWVRQVNFSTLEKQNTHYVSDSQVQRSTDIVWRVQLKLPDGSQEWLYLFLLIEFQSKTDPWMALRMLTYVCLLYQDLIKTEQVKPGEKLPPVFPVVIYNGQATWRASLEIAKLIDAPDSLKCWTPRFRHHLLDQGRVPKAKLKQLSDNLMACLIVLETHLPDDPVILETTRALVELLKDDDFDGLDRAFTRFYRRTILSKLNPGQMTQMPETLEGVTTVLAERIDEWMDGLRQEGERKGEQKGLLKGRQSEAARMLGLQLRLRFGPLPDWAEARLAQAPLEQLEGWIEAVLTAESLEGVIGPEG
ncbi:Rpn family recombination-promoting nuclease/putative transposase [Thauera butanivorans]|uniref:Rpn family recombination-promoting nuclease/putative transposase n=1 Tax=Thauera butanivorans TaxID=86174 RepID=UPI003AB508FE